MNHQRSETISAQRKKVEEKKKGTPRGTENTKKDTKNSKNNWPEMESTREVGQSKKKRGRATPA